MKTIESSELGIYKMTRFGNVIYFGTEKGVYSYDLDTDTMNDLKLPYCDNEVVDEIAITKTGELLVSTSAKKLVHFDSNLQEIQNWNVPSEGTMSLIVDEDYFYFQALDSECYFKKMKFGAKRAETSFYTGFDNGYYWIPLDQGFIGIGAYDYILIGYDEKGKFQETNRAENDFKLTEVGFEYAVFFNDQLLVNKSDGIYILDVDKIRSGEKKGVWSKWWNGPEVRSIAISADHEFIFIGTKDEGVFIIDKNAKAKKIFQPEKKHDKTVIPFVYAYEDKILFGVDHDIKNSTVESYVHIMDNDVTHFY